MKKIFTLLFILCSFASFSQSTTLVISRIFTGAGDVVYLKNQDFVELHNVSNFPVSLSGYSIQYGSATAWTDKYALPAATIPAGGFYLIQMSITYPVFGGTSTDIVPDAVASPAIAMATADGRVALVNGTTLLTGCTASPAIVDLVGFGASTCYEGTAASSALTSSLTLVRIPLASACNDTNNNSSDVVLATGVVGRNSSTPPVTCGLTTGSSTVVISQVYGNGGNSGATYNADYVELHNLSSSTVSLNGYTIQYGSTAVTGAWSGVYALPATASIVPGGYYLIQMSTASATVGIALPTPDAVASPSINMSGTAGRVALVNGLTALSACPAATAYIDYIGFGTTACFEGSGAAPTQTSATADFRKINGCQETNDNFNDFEVLSAAPRNTATTPVLCGAAVPTLTASALTAFGNVCINTTSPANSFTITGTTLTAANVTVGALAGYTYSTTTGGTYTTTLSLTQPGGSYSQQIFVKFTPTAATTYNGNIPVGGGGATTINVAASGTGVNTTATVTSGAASAITGTTATVAGTIPSIGCSAVTAYGIEYSTTAGFTNGTGTAVASTNLTGINFSSALSTLTPGVTYYFHAYATNAGGTAYGAQGQFTTSAAPTLSAGTLTAFGNVCVNATAGSNSFTISGTNLTTANVTVGPLTGYTFSTTAGGTYTASLTLTQTGGTYSQAIFVNFTPTASISYNGNIAVAGGGATTINVAAAGTGINTVPTLTAGAATAITTSSATVAGNITSIGCSAITANYGIEYSTTAGFANGTGTQVVSTNLAAGSFTSALSGLASGTTYYFHAFASNAGGTGYSAEASFLTTATTPVLTAGTLTGFGSVCVNTTSAANSFTINGSALTTANVTVGPLAGYTFSTTAAGTYTASLSLTQPGGTYTQAIFVKFTPAAATTYNGNIPVGGGGATTVNVAATGTGVNTIATVTTGTATAITAISATLAGSIPSIGCSAITVYGVEYSTTAGFANGTGTAVTSTNLAAGNFTSNATGLTASTVYYYHAYATNGGGTAYGAQQQFTTATPSITAGTLTAFGAICLNTAAGPNSFTITGTNLTTANVTVAALAGYTYSTTAAGTYTATLSLTQPGGAYSQTIFVKFTPTAVQSYNGNIAVAGGGVATAVNVAASGSGVNTTATVASGAATSITQNSATVAGTISNSGCSAVTVYGIEYSTTAGFANGTGTAVASTNLVGTGYTSALSGLTPSTTYYYHAYATNSGGTVYGIQQSFTTAAPVLTATALTAFGNVCINNTAGPNTFTISSPAVSAADITVAALPGYTYSTTATGTYTTTLTITHTAGAFSQIVYVKFTPTAVQSYNGNIVVGGGGATATYNVAANGSGVNTGASVTTGGKTDVTRNSATLAGSINIVGSCSPIISYGIEYTSIRNLAIGLGTKVPSTNLNLGSTGGTFSSTITGLVAGTKYYYTAYAVTSAGTTYGVKDSVTTLGINGGSDLTIYSSPIARGGVLNYTITNIRPAHYQISLLSFDGREVYRGEVITQLNFLDGKFTVPAYLPAGTYIFVLRNTNDAGFVASKSFLLL